MQWCVFECFLNFELLGNMVEQYHNSFVYFLNQNLNWGKKQRNKIVKIHAN